MGLLRRGLRLACRLLGPHVGFYGGINYGFGYGGTGYYGGRWEGRTFYYNTAVTNVNRTIVRNIYVDRTNHVMTNSRVSFHGPGGVTARPTAQQRVAMRERHIQATAAQMAYQQQAAKNRNRLASVNRSHPTGTAVATVGRHPTVNPARSNINRVNTTSTRQNASVRTANRNGRVLTTSRATPRAVRQACAVHVNRAERTSVAQTHRTVHNQSSTRTTAIAHRTPARQNHITRTAHAANRVAFEHRTPARHATAPTRRTSAPAHHAQPNKIGSTDKVGGSYSLREQNARAAGCSAENRHRSWKPPSQLISENRAVSPLMITPVSTVLAGI